MQKIRSYFEIQKNEIQKFKRKHTHTNLLWRKSRWIEEGFQNFNEPLGPGFICSIRRYPPSTGVNLDKKGVKTPPVPCSVAVKNVDRNVSKE